jgi:hypothetical protein
MNAQWDLEEEKGSGMEIDSKGPSFKPPYMAKNNSEMDMNQFMDKGERERAMTYYEHMRKEAEDKVCHFCKKHITDDDAANSNLTFLQSSECFHQVHIECLKQ